MYCILANISNINWQKRVTSMHMAEWIFLIHERQILINFPFHHKKREKVDIAVYQNLIFYCYFLHFHVALYSWQQPHCIQVHWNGMHVLQRVSCLFSKWKIIELVLRQETIQTLPLLTKKKKKLITPNKI